MKNLWELIKSSTVAGILIGLGCVAYLCSNLIIVGAILFSLGLITVLVQNRWLYTGKVGFVKNFKELTLVSTALVFNLCGICLTTYLIGKYGELGIDPTSILEAKLNEEWYVALTRSIGCGALMYIAVKGYIETKNILTVVLPVVVFIMCGFDHCIANYGYMAMNGMFYCWQLPIWIIGNAIGSWIISKI